MPVSGGGGAAIPGKFQRAAIVRLSRKTEIDTDDSRTLAEMVAAYDAHFAHRENVSRETFLPPDELLDAWLLKRFPGRFLEELDTLMDWNRFLRSLEAERAEQIEVRRSLYLAGKLKADDISTDEWEVIEAHDAMMGVD